MGDVNPGPAIRLNPGIAKPSAVVRTDRLNSWIGGVCGIRNVSGVNSWGRQLPQPFSSAAYATPGKILGSVLLLMKTRES